MGVDIQQWLNGPENEPNAGPHNWAGMAFVARVQKRGERDWAPLTQAMYQFNH